jgi:transcriptional regulator with XRE-family HTH domain
MEIFWGMSMEFYERLREIRTEHGMTQEQVSKATGIPLRQYQRYEYGDNLPIKRAILLADFFKISIDYLVGRSDVREVK